MSDKKSNIVVIVVAVICILGVIFLINSNKKNNNKETINNEDLNINSEISGEYDATLSDEEKNQIEYVSKNIDLWLGNDEYGIYNYAITDLDQNGRLEIISTTTQGTGIYSTSSIKELNENANGFITIKRNAKKEESEPDIFVPNATVYYNSGDNTYHYIFSDLTRATNTYYTNNIDYTIKDKSIEEKLLSSKTEIYESEENSTVTYSDKDGNEITKDEYDNIENNLFNDYEKKEVSINWITDDDKRVSTLTEEELYELLALSYSNFSIK